MPLMALSSPTPMVVKTTVLSACYLDIELEKENIPTPGHPLIREYPSAAYAALSSFEFPTSKYDQQFQGWLKGGIETPPQRISVLPI